MRRGTQSHDVRSVTDGPVVPVFRLVIEGGVY